MIRSITAVTAMGLTVSGCGLSAQSRMNADYQATTESYKACLRANLERPQDCESARLVMNADEERMLHGPVPPAGGQIMVIGDAF